MSEYIETVTEHGVSRVYPAEVARMYELGQQQRDVLTSEQQHIGEWYETWRSYRHWNGPTVWEPENYYECPRCGCVAIRDRWHERRRKQQYMCARNHLWYGPRHPVVLA